MDGRLLSDRFACHRSDAVVWLALAFLDSVNWPTLSREFNLRVLRNSSRRNSLGPWLRRSSLVGLFRSGVLHTCKSLAGATGV
jgi:hypothetical protein